MASRRAVVTREARQLATRTATAAARALEGYGIIPPPERPPALPPSAVVMLPSRGEVLYRLLSSDEIRERDFLSNHEKDRPPFSGVPHAIHCGVSMFQAPGQALIRANRYPIALAAVTLGAGMGFTLAKTFDIGHYTVWGAAEALQSKAQLLPVVAD